MDTVDIEGSLACATDVVRGGIGAATTLHTATGLNRWLEAAPASLAFASRIPGFAPYRVSGWKLGPPTATGPAAAVIFVNGQFFAGGWNIAPKAMLVDGEWTSR